MSRPYLRAVVMFTLVATLAVPWARVIADHGDETRETAESESERHLTIPLRQMRLTVVYDNNPYLNGLKPAWGFSCYIQTGDKSILFDTGGDAPVLLANMDSLSITPEEIDIVVLSHEHGDHTGGVNALLERNPDITVYLPVSFSASFKSQIRERGAQVVEVGEPVRICKGVYSTGELGSWIKEQSLVCCTDKGLIVITGCAHPGIVLIVNRAKELIGDDVLLAMGGFHLMRADQNEIGDIIKELRRSGLLYAGPCHCSGENARRMFKANYGQNYVEIGVGSSLAGSDFR